MKIRSLAAFSLPVVAAAVMYAPEAQGASREMSVGVGGGYAGYNNGGYAKVFFHYAPIDHVRLAPELGYIFKNKEKSGIEFSLDVQAPFRVWRAISAYPLTGFTVTQWHDNGVGNITCAGVDLGGGVDIYMTSNLKFNVQAKYSIVKKRSGCFVDFGVSYIF